MSPFLVKSFTFVPTFTFKTLWKRKQSSFQRTYATMMPEGPEVRTLVDQLQPAVGKRLVNFKTLSGRYVREPPRGLTAFWNTMSVLDSSDPSVDIVKQLSCKGKFMFIVLDDGNRPQELLGDGDYFRSIWITLGMTGYFMNDKVGENSHSRWYMEFLDVTRLRSGKQDGVASRRVYFQDPRSFGTVRFSLSRQEFTDKLLSLGPDMLDDVFSEESFFTIVASKRPELNICKFLMDQSVR